MLLEPGAAQHPSREGPEFPATQVQFPGMTTPATPTPRSGEPSREAREEEVRDCLRAVVDPELGDTIVDLGMVRTITVDDGDVTVGVALTIAACPLRSQIERDVVNHVRSLDWVRSVDVQVASMDADERAAVMARARWKAREDAPETAIAASTRVLAIASGKGGVGKSSVTVNLAVAPGGQGHGEVDRHGRLADAALARCDGQHPRDRKSVV